MPLVPLTKACSPPSLPGPAALALRPVGLDLRSKPSLPFLDEQALPVFATRLQNVLRQLPGQYSHGLREVLDRDPFVCFPASPTLKLLRGGDKTFETETRYHLGAELGFVRAQLHGLGCSALLNP